MGIFDSIKDAFTTDDHERLAAAQKHLADAELALEKAKSGGHQDHIAAAQKAVDEVNAQISALNRPSRLSLKRRPQRQRRQQRPRKSLPHQHPNPHQHQHPHQHPRRRQHRLRLQQPPSNRPTR
jgi:hypothetical protein